ncbi:MAG: PIG-L family deacetylase [Chloroflexota bacterium]
MEQKDIGRVLVVFAHPDDAEYGCAGTVAVLARNGADVVYIVTTDGSKGSSDAEMTPNRLTKIRQEEQRSAARVTGVADVCFLNFPDGMLEPTLELRREITACIRQYKPDVLICQNPIRDLTASAFAQHPDHLATGEAALAAVYPSARDRLTFPELLERGLQPHIVKEVWVQGTSAPDHFMDITSSLDVKIAALLEHVSQVDPERIRRMIPERAAEVGKQHGMEYAEAFHRIRLA